MKIGYARVSRDDQNLDLQISALRDKNCSRIFTDLGQSGASFQRAGLLNALKSLSSGDTLVVWRLDRLGRSLFKLIELVDLLGRQNVEFQSLCENIDTATSGGRLMFHMMGALAEFERSLISERTCAGLYAARRRGKKLGRPLSLEQYQVAEAYCAVARGKATLKDVAQSLNVSERTLRRRMRELVNTTGLNWNDLHCRRDPE
ncbi:MAG: recombinase family protein [Hydrogenophaga sp.]|nr:recombinase family protein [Hydrogenophaga sp.]